MFAIIDPNWGDPRVVPETIRTTGQEAVEVAVMDESMSLYSGAILSQVPPVPGSWEQLQAYGFKLARVAVKIEEAING